MTRPGVLQSLMWKDARSIKTLTQLLIILSIAFTLGAVANHWLGRDARSPENSLMIALLGLYLVPTFYVLGAPALMIGGEQDEKTFDWLRTLPVSWITVVTSNWLVLLGGLFVVVLASSISVGLTISVAGWPFDAGASGFTVPTAALLTLSIETFLLVVTLAIVATSAYWFRSPVTGLGVAIPAATTFVIGLTILGNTGNPPDWSSGRAFWIVMLVVGLVALQIVAFFVAVSFAAARRRLRSPERTSHGGAPRSNVSAYRPPKAISRKAFNPAVTLLWQQWRQVGRFCLGASALVVALSLIEASPGQTVLWVLENSLEPTIVLLSLFSLGALTFFHDASKRRCEYFATHGISPTNVWWTRVLPTAVTALLIAGYSVHYGVLSDSQRGEIGFGKLIGLTLLMSAYAVGQWVSQGVRRPSLAFFAGPAAGMILIFPVQVFFNFYPGYLPLLSLSVIVLLLTTWRLSSRWIQSGPDTGYVWRWIGYLGLAMLAATAPTLIHRAVTTPAARPDFRAAMMSTEIGSSSSGQGQAVTLNPAAFSHVRSLDRDSSLDGFATRLRLERDDADSVGESVRWQEVTDYLFATVSERDDWYDSSSMPNGRRRTPPQAGLSVAKDDATIALAIGVMIDWSRQARRAALIADISDPLVEVAEPALRIAVKALRASDLDADLKGPLIAELGQEVSRRESRRDWLVNRWRRYQKITATSEYRVFAGYRVLDRPAVHLAIERRRSDRWMDVATERLLSAIDAGTYFVDGPTGRVDLQAATAALQQATFLPQRERDNAASLPRIVRLAEMVRSWGEVESKIESLD